MSEYDNIDFSNEKMITFLKSLRYDQTELLNTQVIIYTKTNLKIVSNDFAIFSFSFTCYKKLSYNISIPEIPTVTVILLLIF